MVRGKEGQGCRPRHPGQRSSARHCHRPAAQRAAASASRRRIQEMVRRPRLEGRFPGMGAGAPHPVQERHIGDRERWRGHRQGHLPALLLRAVPVELGARRRLHHPARCDHRSERELPDRKRGEVPMIVRKFSEAKPYEAPNHRAYKSFRVYGAEMGGSQTLVFGISHFLPGGGAGPDASPPEKIYYVLAGELTVIAGGKETVARVGDSVYIGPNESREIINRSNEGCTIAVAVAPVK